MLKTPFIAIEGIDGTGKSTLARRLVTKLELKSEGAIKPVRKHEPSSFQLEDTIRQLFKRKEGPLCPEAMSVLFTADRLICMEQNKCLAKKGFCVITDRHKLSTRVYQEVNGCDPKVLKILCDVPSPNPDLTIVLDIDPNLARERMLARNPNLDSYESDLSKQHEMRRLYKLYARDYGDAVIFDASLNEDELSDRVASFICENFLCDDS